MSETAPAGRRTRWARFIPLVLIAALLAVLVASGELKHLSLSELADHRVALTAFVQRHPIASLAAYFALFVLVIVACVPGPSVMAVSGGFLFGTWIGGAATLAGGVVGSVIVFLACRTAFGDWAAHRAGPMVARVEAGFSRNAFSYLLALRLMPVAPFFLVNISAGLARIRLSTLILATVIGSAPSSFIFAGLGSGLGELFQRHVKVDASLLARPQIIVPLGALALMSLAPAAWRLWRARPG
ncbi:MAG: TVP38/TMEM64 family protein [Caulobacterales bacterium]